MVPDSESWLLDEVANAGRENLDAAHVASYDDKEDADAATEVALLAERGILSPATTAVDMGAGTGQFTLQAAAQCSRVVAVDVSPVMIERLRENVRRAGLTNVRCVRAGFLTYEHDGPPVDLVYSRYALHHLPDFWKAVALCRLASLLRPGGALRLWDVVYDFDPLEADARFAAWMAELNPADAEHGWTRADLAEHIRDEHSTFTWLLEPMLERAGFEIAEARSSDAGVFAQYLCTKR